MKQNPKMKIILALEELLYKSNLKMNVAVFKTSPRYGIDTIQGDFYWFGILVF